MRYRTVFRILATLRIFIWLAAAFVCGGLLAQSGFSVNAIGGSLLILFAAAVLSRGLGPDRRRDDLRERIAHRKCVECGYDLRASPLRCPECGHPVHKTRRQFNREFRLLRDDWPGQTVSVRIPKSHEAPVVIHQSTNLIEARLLCEQLNSRGVFSRVEEHPIVGRGWGRFAGDARVLIWSDDAELATEIRNKLIKPKPDPNLPEKPLDESAHPLA